MGRHHAGAVLFTVNLRKLAHFYEQVVELRVVKSASDHIVLEIETFRLTVHQIPESYAKSIVITTPPFVRENAAIKLSFRVKDLSRARHTASELGGFMNGPDREWSNEGATTCDGHDPDGNVFQLFQVEEAKHGLKPKTIDEFLAHVSADKRAALEKLRRTIHATVPKAEECINYGVPAFRLNGKLFVAFGAGAKHCSSIQAHIPSKSIKTNSRLTAPAKGQSVFQRTVLCQSP